MTPDVDHDTPTTDGSAPSTVDAGDLRTKRETFDVYIRRGSAQVFLAVGAALVVARLAVADFGVGDLIVVTVTAVLFGPAEWCIHKFLLHAPEDAWTNRTLGTGVNHRQHHLEPTALDTLLLSGLDAAIFTTVFGVSTVGWVGGVAALAGTAAIGPILTAWAIATLGLAHYEWVHLLVHTRYRCRSRYYERLARNHRLHHFRNENYWLGVTTNFGDRLLGTYPAHKSDVELSDTARTLGRTTT